jgi:phosphate transport system substrate-binding protein
LAEAYRIESASALISVSGGGSGLGIASLLNGNADIANSSRRINTEEIELFAARGVEIDSFVFAQDAIAFVVSEQLKIDSLSTLQLSQLLSGQITTWSPFANSNLPVTIYGRQSNSGTHDFVQQALQIKFSPHAKQMNGNAQILEAIKVDPSGIGYVGAGYIDKQSAGGINVLKVYSKNKRAISPLNSEEIAAGNYLFQRPLYQYYKKKDYKKIQPFLDFEKSIAGKLVIYACGYYMTNELK